MMSKYVVVNRSKSGKLTVRVLEAFSQLAAVQARYEELVKLIGPREPEIVAVSGALPSQYGTGASYLHSVDQRPPTPPTPLFIVGGVKKDL